MHQVWRFWRAKWHSAEIHSSDRPNPCCWLW